MNFKKNPKSSISIDITPMIDVMFILIIFFLITTTFVSNPGLEIDLPRASLSEIENANQPIEIVLSKDGSVMYSGKLLNQNELSDELDKLFKNDPQKLVIIQADKNTPHGIVVQLMELIKKTGFQKLGIAAESE